MKCVYLCYDGPMKYTDTLNGSLLESIKRCRRGVGSHDDYRAAFRFADDAALAKGESPSHAPPAEAGDMSTSDGLGS